MLGLKVIDRESLDKLV